MTTIIEDQERPLIWFGKGDDVTPETIADLRRAIEDMKSSHPHEAPYVGGDASLPCHPATCPGGMKRAVLALLDAVSPVAANERIAVLEEALRHRREYDDKGWSHVECGAEESIRERLALLAAVSPVAVEPTTNACGWVCQHTPAGHLAYDLGHDFVPEAPASLDAER